MERPQSKELRLEELMQMYVIKAQTHDQKTMNYIKTAIMARYQMNEETFKERYTQHVTEYVAQFKR